MLTAVSPRWYEIEIPALQQKAASIEEILTWLVIQRLNGDEKRVRRMRFVDKINLTRDAASALDDSRCDRLLVWLARVDEVRAIRNRLAHSTLARVMVGPDEGEDDEAPDRVGLIGQERGLPVVWQMTRAESSERNAAFDEILQQGLVLSASAMEFTTLEDERDASD